MTKNQVKYKFETDTPLILRLQKRNTEASETRLVGRGDAFGKGLGVVKGVPRHRRRRRFLCRRRPRLRDCYSIEVAVERGLTREARPRRASRGHTEAFDALDAVVAL